MTQISLFAYKRLLFNIAKKFAVITLILLKWFKEIVILTKKKKKKKKKERKKGKRHGNCDYPDQTEKQPDLDLHYVFRESCCYGNSDEIHGKWHRD